MEVEDDSATDGNHVSCFILRFIPSFWTRWAIHSFRLIFSSQLTVRGRPKLCIPFWRSLGTSQFNVISQGYKIPFFELPTPFFKANNAPFESKAVNELLHANLVAEIFCVPDTVCFRA